MVILPLGGPHRAARGRRGLVSWQGVGRIVALGAAAGLAVAGAVAPAAATAPAAQLLTQSDNPLGSYLAGRVAVANHDFDAGAAFLRDALRADPREPLLLVPTLSATLADGQIDAGLRLAEQLAKVQPDNPLARVTLAVRDFKLHHYRSARTEITRSLNGQVPDMVSALVTAWAWAGSGETRKALAAVDQVNGDTLSNLFRDFHSGLIAAVGGRDKIALDRLTSALAGDPTNFVLVDALARFKAHQGDIAGALKVYGTLADKPHHNPMLDADVATLKAGKPLPLLVRNADEGLAEALFGFGQIASHGRSPDFALVYLNLALYLQPDHNLALLTLADLYESLGDYQTAIETYRRLPPNSPFQLDSKVRIATDVAAGGNNAEAESQLKALIAAHPDNVQALTALGNLQHHEKEYVTAAATFTRAINALKNPDQDDWALYFARAVSYHLAGDWPKAEADLKAALKLSPKQAAVLNYLGYSWIDRGEHMQEGLKMIREAVALRPNDGDIVDSLAWAHYRLGDFEAARTEELRAVELKPGSWEINDHLGDIDWRTGRHLEARFQWLHALAFGADKDKRPGIERKLKDGLPPLEVSDHHKAVTPETAPSGGTVPAAPGHVAPAPPSTPKVPPKAGLAPAVAPAKSETGQSPPPVARPAAAKDAPAAAPPAAAPAAGSVSPAAVTPAAASAPQRRTVTVQPGDSLWSIAADVLGDARLYPALMHANGLRRHQPIFPGETLVVPDVATR